MRLLPSSVVLLFYHISQTEINTGWLSENNTRLLMVKVKVIKNIIRDARTPQPEEIIFNTMRYRSTETVQRLGHFQSSVSYIKGPTNV